MKIKAAREKLLVSNCGVKVVVLRATCFNRLICCVFALRGLRGALTLARSAFFLLASSVVWANSDVSQESARLLFSQAMNELRTGAGPRYNSLRVQLERYPLAIYLDYEYAISRLHYMTAAQALQFLESAEHSPLHNRFLAAYIEHKGRDKGWRALLGVLDAPPRDERLQCFYYRALRANRRESEAWAGAAALWNVGYSQDDACDPLFDRWMTQGSGPDDGLIWSRALKAFDARNPHLIRYLQRYASEALRPVLEELYGVYYRPDALVHDAHEPDFMHAQLMTVAIRRLARINPEKARLALANAVGVQAFSDQSLEAMESMIARHSLFAQAAVPDPWLLSQLERLADDELTEIYLRKQVQESDWKNVLQALAWLSLDAQQKDQWQYWRARALEATGEISTAHSVYNTLALQRSYHGFLAADKMGAAYQLNPLKAPVPKKPDDSAVARVVELLALQRLPEAKQEWRALLARLSQSQGLAAGQWALEQGWDDLAIETANYFSAWDQVALRFPNSFFKAFTKQASQLGLEHFELQAIARRESAFYTRAESAVGARGLMQLMPATARQVAKRIGVPYRRAKLFDPEYNVLLGSHYYHRLLERFDGHRPKALAGYNAGPHRVDRWVNKAIPVDQWIDSLPFKETREYVQAVLAYTVIYRARAGQIGPILRRDEWSLTHQSENL